MRMPEDWALTQQMVRQTLCLALPPLPRMAHGMAVRIQTTGGVTTPTQHLQRLQ